MKIVLVSFRDFDRCRDIEGATQKKVYLRQFMRYHSAKIKINTNIKRQEKAKENAMSVVKWITRTASRRLSGRGTILKVRHNDYDDGCDDNENKWQTNPKVQLLLECKTQFLYYSSDLMSLSTRRIIVDMFGCLWVRVPLNEDS